MFQHPPEPCSRPAATGWEPAKEKPLPKRNYGFEKRQKEISKKQKKEAKMQRKLERAQGDPEAATDAETALQEPGTID